MYEQQSVRASAKTRVLYVEDDLDSGELVRFLLSRENENYAVTVVKTFAEAVTLINESHFNLYILDYCLPLKSGIQLCYHIRQTDSNTPILFYSALGDERDHRTALRAGANDYVVKPDSETLVKRVNQFLLNGH